MQPFTLWNNVYSNFIHPKAHSSRFLQNQHLRVVLLVVDVTDFFMQVSRKCMKSVCRVLLEISTSQLGF